MAMSECLPPITILIADDHLMVRRGLVALLQPVPDFLVVGEAADGEDAVEQAVTFQPQVVLMDVKMPRCDGIAAGRRIRAHRPATGILCLTQYDDEARLFAALDSNVQGYLLKNAEPEILFAAIRVVAAGNRFIDPELMPDLLQEFCRRGIAPPPAPVLRSSAAADLTVRELAVVQQIAAGRSNKEIAQALCLTENTIKHNVTRVLKKLQLANRAQLATFVHQHGLG